MGLTNVLILALAASEAGALRSLPVSRLAPSGKSSASAPALRAAAFSFDAPISFAAVETAPRAEAVRRRASAACGVVAAGVVARSAVSICPSPLGAIQAYNAALVAQPFATKAVGTGLTYFLSDLTAQLLENKDRPRFRRGLKFAAVGAFWVGPLLAAWFQVMDALVPGRTPGPVLVKILADQVLQGPFMIATMFLWTGLMNGASVEAIGKTLRKQLKPTWIKSVWVWSPVQAVQQVLVPIEYRVAVANFVSYFWDTYLAHEMKPADDCAVAPEPAAADEPEAAAIIDDVLFASFCWPKWSKRGKACDDDAPVTVRDPSLLYDFVLA